MKRRKIIALLACACLGSLVLGACGSKNESSGDLKYAKNDAGTGYMVIGIGECKDTEIVVPATYDGLPVTEIRYQAFDYYDKMTGITLPDSITTIGEEAFAYCENLKRITFGAGLQTIEQYAFAECPALESVSFGNALVSVGTGAFELCKNLQTVTFGKGATVIGEEAFKSCEKLSSVTFGGVEEIGVKAFQNCVGLQEVNLGVVEQVKQGAFLECENLKHLNMGSALMTVGEDAFGGCVGLQTVYVPTTVSKLTMDNFTGVTKLSALYFMGNKEQCTFENAFRDIDFYFYSETDPFLSETVDATLMYWHRVNGKAVHWNCNAGSSCVIVTSTDTGAHVVAIKEAASDVKWNGKSNASVTATTDGISVSKAFLYANPGINIMTWRTAEGTLNVYKLKAVRDGIIDFEDGENEFVHAISAVNVAGVKQANATTGNGAKSLQMDATGSSVYIAFDADYVHAVFANTSVSALQFKIYTPYDLRQKLAWYYTSFKLNDQGETVDVGNQITSYISYEDKGDYLLINFTRRGYEEWKIRNVNINTDLFQLLFRFTRDAQAGEAPSTDGQDKTTQYVWIRKPGTFYIDDIQGVS